MRGSEALRAAARLLALLMLLALAGCGEKPPPLPALAEADVVLAFGDSLTYGTGAAEHESYPVVLAGLIGRRVVRSGVPGEVSAAALERLPEALEEHEPRLLILCTGGNDMLRKLDEAQLAANLREMIRLAREQGVAVVLVGVPRPGFLSGPPPLYAEIAGEMDVPYEGEVLKEILYDNRTKSDYVHPNGEGYRLMAQAVAELLRRAGAVR